ITEKVEFEYVYGNQPTEELVSTLLIEETVNFELEYTIGSRQYELSNHLGNVLAVISDWKLPVISGASVVSYTTVVVSSQDYSPFGVTLSGRSWSAGYRYGFNGLEYSSKLDSYYDSDFRCLNTLLGRWISIDPVNHEFMSPYNAMDCNPLMIYDPTGADGEGDSETGVISSTIYIKFDTDANLTDQEKTDYVNAFKAQIDAVWQNISMSDGTKISTSNVTVLVAPDGLTSQDLKRNENLLVAGNGEHADPDQMHGVSYIDQNRRNNTGYMYLSNNAREAAHEFGHILGLSDRYFEGVVTDILSHSKQLSSTTRLTMPIADIKDKGYNYLNNLMSNGGGHLTEKQISIAFNRNRKERSYTSIKLLHQQHILDNNEYDGVGLKGHYFKNNFCFEKGNGPIKYDSSLKINLTHNWHVQQVQQYIRNNNLD
ncbi:MAG: RHS repeat-associated core domain-containing protein, partial [Flavobacteriales bacterium]